MRHAIDDYVELKTMRGRKSAGSGVGWTTRIGDTPRKQSAGKGKRDSDRTGGWLRRATKPKEKLQNQSVGKVRWVAKSASIVW